MSSSNEASYPLKDIEFPHDHDVLCGRGGRTNSHPGNTHWRMLIAANKELYVLLPKCKKILVSKSIVRAIRSQNPPGRFLHKEENSDLWYDVGDIKAQEKTSQALREGAPDIRSKVLEGVSHDVTGSAENSWSTPQSYNVNIFVPTGSEPAAMYPPAMGGPHYMAYPPMLMTSGMPQHYFPPHMPPPTLYPHARQRDPTLYSPQQVTSVPDLTEVPTLSEEPAASNKTSDETLGEPSETEKCSPMDSQDNNTELEKPDMVPGDSCTFGSIDTLRLESMGISSFGSKLETAGTSFGSMMSYSRLPEPLDGGLQPFSMSFGSLSLNEMPSRSFSLTKVTREMPANYETPTLLSQQRSTESLLESSDSESEDESEVTNSLNKTCKWEKMRAVFDLQERDKNTATIGKNASVPPTALNPDISCMSAFSPISSQDTPPPALNPDISCMSAFSTISSCNERSSSMQTSPTHVGDELSEQELLEKEYLNRGVSLVCEDFGKNRGTSQMYEGRAWAAEKQAWAVRKQTP